MPPLASIAVAPTNTPPVSNQVNAVASPVVTVASQAPVSAEARPVLRRPGSISITQTVSTYSTSGEAEQRTQTVVSAPAAPVYKSFTAQDVLAAWFQYAERMTDNVRMQSLLKNANPQLIDEKTLQVAVDNILQEKDLQKWQGQIMSFIHTTIGNNTLRISIIIQEQTAKVRGYSPDERYNMLVEKNSALALLRTGLALEID